MTDFFVSQAGAGAMDGISEARAWSYALINWSTAADNDLYVIEGEITSNFVVGNHGSSSSTPVKIRGNFPGNPGSIHVASGNAATISAATNRNYTEFHNITILSDAGNGVRLDSGAGMIGRKFFNCTIDGNGARGVNIASGADEDHTDLVFDGCSISGNVNEGIRGIDVTGNFIIDQLTINNCTINNNGSDGCRINNASANTTASFTNWVITNNSFNDNGNAPSGGGDPGCRIGSFNGTHQHGFITFTGNQCNRNGTGEGGGGALIQGYSDSGGSRGDTNVYIANNTFNFNGGENGGLNCFGLLNGLVERNICSNNFVADDLEIVDGNGIIADNNCDSMEFQYNECSDNLGSNDRDNSGVGIMVLFDTSDIRIHHNQISGCKIGLWSGHNESTATQADIEFTNNVCVDCVEEGFHQAAQGSPLVNTVKNNIFTGASGSNFGINNARDGGSEQLVADFNLIFGFTSAYNDQTPGANDVTADPLLTNFRIASTSPARNAGATLTFDTDADGNVHGVDGDWDMGGYEFVEPNPGGLILGM